MHRCTRFPSSLIVRRYSTHKDTIFSLSSGGGKSAISVIRVSGKQANNVVQQLTQKSTPEPRVASLRNIYHPITKEKLDQSMVLWFPGPHSYTGEDIAELHVHGSRAVVHDTLAALESILGTRVALPGEFTRRAFHNGKLDLTEVEGIADLINAQTQAQRRLALSQMQGNLGKLYNRWREDIIQCMAFVEAWIDFGDDEELDPKVVDRVRTKVISLKQSIEEHLKDGRRGERMRDGVNVVIVGPPNAGKSSLMNILAQRKASIVSPIPGTTRDVVEVMLDIGGYPVILGDTAGIHVSSDPVESIGIGLAKERITQSDIKICVLDMNDTHNLELTLNLLDDNTVLLFNKLDSYTSSSSMTMASSPTFSRFKHKLNISCLTNEGIPDFMKQLEALVAEFFQELASDMPVLTRMRHRQLLAESVESLQRYLVNEGDIVMAAEELRAAINNIGAITGKVGVEQILGTIFSEFCIGK